MPRYLLACGWLALLMGAGLIPFTHLEANGVPTPWQGRLYMAVVTVAFAAILAAAFQALGRPETRHYFGLTHRRAGAGR